MNKPQNVYSNRFWLPKPAMLLGGMYDENITSVIASLHDDKHWDNNGKSVENDFFCNDDGVHVRSELLVEIRQEVLIDDLWFFQFYVSGRNGYWWTEAKNVRIV